MWKMKSNHSLPDKPQNQAFFQVVLPFLLVFLLVIFAGILLFSRISSGTTDIRVWADIAVVLIILPLLLGCVLFLVAIIIFIALAIELQKKTAALLKRVNSIAFNINGGIAKIAQSFIKPLIHIISRSSILKRK